MVVYFKKHRSMYFVLTAVSPGNKEYYVLLERKVIDFIESKGEGLFIGSVYNIL